MQDLFDVAGKTAVVTGGSRGIGEMIARGFAENGVITYISSRSADACEEVASKLSSAGKCVAVPADLSTAEGIDTLVKAVSAETDTLDILVNNAGANWAAPFDEFPESGWDKVVDLNLKSIFFLTQSFMPLLRASASQDDPARIINIGSIDGLHVPGLETYAYSASKAALHHMTRVLAARLAPDDVTVNAIAPGPFQSKMMAATLETFGKEIIASNPRKRIGTPEDIAGVSIFLASRAAAYVTGAVLPCDGGISTTL